MGKESITTNQCEQVRLGIYLSFVSIEEGGKRVKQKLFRADGFWERIWRILTPCSMKRKTSNHLRIENINCPLWTNPSVIWFFWVQELPYFSSSTQIVVDILGAVCTMYSIVLRTSSSCQNTWDSNDSCWHLVPPALSAVWLLLQLEDNSLEPFLHLCPNGGEALPFVIALCCQVFPGGYFYRGCSYQACSNFENQHHPEDLMVFLL